MKAGLAKILPFALSLLLVVTGQSVAESRGVDNAVGQMVLCTGTGPVVVYMDREGQPTRAPHYCPDYALFLLGALAAPPSLLPERPQQTLPAPVRNIGNLVALPLPQRPARAPPVLV